MGKIKKERTKSRFEAESSTSTGVLSSEEIASITNDAEDVSSEGDDGVQDQEQQEHGESSTASSSSSSSSTSKSSSSKSSSAAATTANEKGIILGRDGLFDDSQVDAYGAPIGELNSSLNTTTITTNTQTPLRTNKNEEGIVTLYNLLASHEDSEREYACGGFANIVLEPQGLEVIQRNPNIISAIVNCMSDSVLDVRTEAAGAIRNICLSGGADYCPTLVQMGLMPSLLSSVSEASILVTSNLTDLATALANDPSTLDQNTQNIKINADQSVEFMEHIINSIWLLCENSEAALNLFNESSLLISLIQCVSNYPQVPISLCIIAGQCLQTVIEDNQAALNAFLQNSELLNSLFKTLNLLETASSDDFQTLLLRVTISGILFNTRVAWPTESYATILQTVLLHLKSALAIDGVAIVNSVIPLLSSIASVDAFSAVQTAQGPPPEQLQFKNTKNLLSAQQSALEVLTNICSVDSNSDDGVWEDVGGADDDESSEALEITNEQQLAADQGQLRIPDEIVTLLINLEIPSKIFSLIAAVPPGVFQILVSHRVGQTLLKSLVTIQTRALCCFGNMLGAIDFTVLISSIHNDVGAVWQQLLEQFVDTTLVRQNYGDEEFYESFTSTIWAYLRATRQFYPNSILATTEEQLQGLYLLGKNSTSENVRVNVFGLIGVLASLPEQTKFLSAIAAGLLDVANNDPSLLVVSEALNSIFDVYAEPVVNESVIQSNMMAQLQAILPNLRQKIRAQKSSLSSETFNRADETRINLARFIKYKMPQFV